MAHVIANHASLRQDQARQAAIASQVVGDVLSNPSAGALTLSKSQVSLASFSRAQEFEADSIGVGIAARAGFDPLGAARLLAAMERNAELRAGASNARAADFMASHPATPERIKKARLNARQYSNAGERDKAAYLAALDGVVYGDDPADGFARGRRFIHPRFGFTFTAPEGFTLDNTAQAILGVREDARQAMRLDAVKIPPEQTLGAYLASGWIENVDAASAQDLRLNGAPAATATAKGADWSYRLYVARVGNECYRFIYAAKSMTPAVDQAFRASFESFRRLSASEAEAAKPLHLSIVTVRAGDTAEALGQRHMASLDHPVERFRMINGLGPSEQVKLGDQVKIVME
jgi:predicted Zn-dependent protease